MLRYNKQYQEIADKFAIEQGEGEWIGAKYLGQYHETCCDALGPGWLAFEPIWKDEECKVGLYHYIFIDEERLLWYSDIYKIRYKTIHFGRGEIRHEKKITPVKLKTRPIPRHQQYVVAITTEICNEYK